MGISHLTSSENRVLSDFVSRVREKSQHNPAKMILFGSRARREGDDHSDIDVLVLLKRIDRDLKFAIWDLASDLFLDTDINISPLVMSENQFRQHESHERLIAKEINRDGIPL